MAQKEVSHTGRIVSIGQDRIQVEIVSQSACASCHAAGLCGASESVKKLVEVSAFGNSDVKVGDEVEVCFAQSMGLKAVLISYVIPVIILLILIVSLSTVKGLKELAVGLISVAGVALYYLVVYLMRDRIAGGYEFYIRKNN